MPNTPARPSATFLRLTLWLALGGALLLFAMGRNTIAAAAWLAPVFLIRYTRQVGKKPALALVWLVLAGAFLFQFRGMVPMPLPGVLATAAAGGVGGMLPYLVDRWAHRRFRNFAATLIFPCVLTVMYFGTVLSPFGSWGVLGYSQYGNLPVMQLAAVTGIYGISFLVAWLGSWANWAWERGFRWGRIRWGTMAFGSVLAAVYLGGSARLRWAGSAPTQRVAAIAGNAGWIFLNQSVQDRFWSGQALSPEELAPTRAGLAAQTERLLQRSERAAQAGARLVLWSETVTAVLRADEPAMLARAAETARRNQIYLGVAYARFDPGISRLHQNKLVLIGPDGRPLFAYLKSRPVPGPEKDSTETNGNPMPYADTTLGRIGGFICFDLDFPSLVRQAGRAHTDVMIAPSNDWLAIDPWNTELAAFRAVENGCALIRDVSHGRSLVVDAFGRVRGETDYFQDARHILMADVPVRGVTTLYAKIGDLFAWACVLALGLILVAGARQQPTPVDPPTRA